MAVGEQQIAQEVIPILAAMSFDGNVARLEGQLDRAAYVSVNKVLEALGGKWNKKIKGHLFDGTPQEIIGDAIVSGSYVDEKKAFQFYETSDALADEMLAPVDLDRVGFFRILEPSAGAGALLRAVERRGEGYLFPADAVEINPKHKGALEKLGVDVAIADFLSLTPETKRTWEIEARWRHDIIGRYDLVLMNPPFTRSQDIAHVLHAYNFLNDGGELVAIMSKGFTFREDHKATEFRAWLKSVAGTYKANAADTFKASGAMVNTVLVRITKNAPAN